jgi:acyl-CoA-binding protein
MAHLVSFPEKFELACDFMNKFCPVETSTSIGAAHRLAFYALYQQATVGMCNTKPPSQWNIRERFKYDAWKELGSMSQLEAMVFYVQMVEREVDRNWFEKIRGINGGEEEMKVIDSDITTTTTSAVVVPTTDFSQPDKPSGYEAALKALQQTSEDLQKTCQRLDEALQANDRLAHELALKKKECEWLRQQLPIQNKQVSSSEIAPVSVNDCAACSTHSNASTSSGLSSQIPAQTQAITAPSPTASRTKSKSFDASNSPSLDTQQTKIVHYYYSSDGRHSGWWGWLWPWQNSNNNTAL